MHVVIHSRSNEVHKVTAVQGTGLTKHESGTAAVERLGDQETLFLLLISCGAVLANQCCPNGGLMIPRGYCAGGSNQTRINMTCEAGMALILNVYVKNGAIYESNAPNYAFSTNPDEYCIGTMLRNQSEPLLGNMSVGIVCFDSPENSQQVSGVLTLVSVVFLVLTLGVYLYIPQLRDVEGLCYVSLCISMCLGFLALGTLQLDPGYENELCHFIGFMIYLWIMATFFWMNVISIHVYRTINDSAYLKNTPRKQLIIYSAYAWGCSVFMTLVTVISNYTEHNHLKPGIGSNNCWFQGRTETWAYFYGPVAIVIASNVILFILSSLKLWRQTMKYEVSKLNRLKFNFLLSLKLFLVMGISWIFEIASFAHGQSHVIWQIMDTFNCLQGIVIFLILVVFRRRAIRGLAGDSCCMPLTGRWAAMLSPHEDSEDENMIDEDHTEVRLN